MTDRSVTKGTRRRRPEARPAEILDAALELFSERGFAATRMDDVAKQAGLSKGALYLYFPDKVALLKALVQEKTESLIGMATQMAQAHQGPVAPLVPLLLGALAEKIDTTNFAALLKLVISESRAHPDVGRSYLDQVIARAFPVMEGLITRGVASGEFQAVDPAMAVRSLIAPMLLAAFWKSVFEPLGAAPFSARDLARHHAELMLKALRP